MWQMRSEPVLVLINHTQQDFSSIYIRIIKSHILTLYPNIRICNIKYQPCRIKISSPYPNCLEFTDQLIPGPIWDHALMNKSIPYLKSWNCLQCSSYNYIEGFIKWFTLTIADSDFIKAQNLIL